MYEEQAATALASITEKGKAYVLRELTEGTPADSLKPWEPGTPAIVNHAIFGVKARWTKGELDSGIKRSDIKLLVPASGLTVDVTTKMVVVDEDEATEVPFNIQHFDLIDPNGEKILYFLQLRR